MTGREKLMMAVCAAMGLVTVTAHGQTISYTTVGSSYSQDFNTLPSAQGTGTSAFGTWTDNLTLAGWYGAVGTTPGPITPPAPATNFFRISDGSSNAGSLYSFGVNGDSDRALGSISSGSTGPTGGPTGVFYGMQLTNNTGVTLSTFTISYTGELWRAVGTTSATTSIQNTLSAAYSTTATNVYDTTAGVYTAATALDFKAPDAGSPGTWSGADAAVNGNNATYQRTVSATINITGGWAPGTNLWVRWLDVNDAGNDQGLALDNLTFSAAPHVAVHNGTVLTVSGSKTAPVQDFGRVVAGNASPTATVNLSNTTGAAASTTFADVSQDGSSVTPASGPVAAGGSTPLTVKIAASANPAPPTKGTFGGHDINTTAVIQNTGEDNDANVSIPMKMHAVLNRFVDNYSDDDLGGGPTYPVNVGAVLVGKTVTTTVKLSTINENTSDYSSNTLTTVGLQASTTASGFIGGSTSGFASGTLAAGTNGDVVFDDASDSETRTLTITALQSGQIVAVPTGTNSPAAATGIRGTGFLSVPLQQLDSAVGASGDARVYVKGDFYAPAGITGTASAGTVTLTNTAPVADGTFGKTVGAEILGTSVNQSGWTVGGLTAGTKIGAARASFTASGQTTATPAVTPTVAGTISLNTAGKINGTYGANLTVSLQNDQSSGVAGVAPNDLAPTVVALSATVSDKPAVQNGAYSLDGGTLSAPATTLTGSFTQSGGSSTFASVVGGGSVTVSGGSLTLSPGATTNVVKSLSVSGTGKVDLTSAKLVVDYTGSTPSNAIRVGLQVGSSGTWSGNGLTSSDAAANAAQSYAIGYGEASLILGLSGAATATWNGATVDATSLLIKETYYGDANLDGVVNADDLARLDLGHAKNLPAGTATWTDGDFNYDGSVTVADYLLADTAFALHGGALSPELLAERKAEFGDGYVSTLLASVPEPTSLGLVGVIGAGLLGRRRRSAK